MDSIWWIAGSPGGEQEHYDWWLPNHHAPLGQHASPHHAVTTEVTSGSGSHREGYILGGGIGWLQQLPL